MTTGIPTTEENGTDNSAPLRILIVRLSAVGDVIHALPVINAIREAVPGAHIGWAVHPGAANLLEAHPQIDELIVVPRKVFSLKGISALGSLRNILRGSGGWNWAIDCQGLTKSGMTAWLSGAPRRAGFSGSASRELNALFMTDRIAPKSRLVIHMNLELLNPLGITGKSVIAMILATADDHRHVKSWAQERDIHDERFIVIDPFAGWKSKLWEQANWIAVAKDAGKRFNYRTLVIHGPGEIMKAEALAHDVRAAGGDAIAAPPTTLRQLAALLSDHAACMVAGDTGPMHMAAALGIPTVGLYGPSDSRRNAPAFDDARIEILQDYSQPCAGTFTRRCRFHPPEKCMATITPGQVLDALTRLVGA